MEYVLQAWVVGVFWTVEILIALNAPEDHEYTLLSAWDRLTSEECWQLDNFGVIRKDFMGWVIDETVKGLLK